MLVVCILNTTRRVVAFRLLPAEIPTVHLLSLCSMNALVRYLHRHQYVSRWVFELRASRAFDSSRSMARRFDIYNFLRTLNRLVRVRVQFQLHRRSQFSSVAKAHLLSRGFSFSRLPLNKIFGLSKTSQFKQFKKRKFMPITLDVKKIRQHVNFVMSLHRQCHKIKLVWSTEEE